MLVRSITGFRKSQSGDDTTAVGLLSGSVFKYTDYQEESESSLL